jgi:DNA-binding transcriptional regulator YiaG
MLRSDLTRAAQATLFRQGRKALQLGTPSMARALGVADGSTVRLWESGRNPISGQTWVALLMLLREAGEHELAAEVLANLPEPTRGWWHSRMAA